MNFTSRKISIKLLSVKDWQYVCGTCLTSRPTIFKDQSTFPSHHIHIQHHSIIASCIHHICIHCTKYTNMISSHHSISCVIHTLQHTPLHDVDHIIHLINNMSNTIQIHALQHASITRCLHHITHSWYHHATYASCHHISYPLQHYFITMHPLLITYCSMYLCIWCHECVMWCNVWCVDVAMLTRCDAYMLWKVYNVTDTSCEGFMVLMNIWCSSCML